MCPQFAVVEELFSGYTVVYNYDTEVTSVWCDRCEEWVFESDDTESDDNIDLYERAIESHKDERIRFRKT